MAKKWRDRNMAVAIHGEEMIAAHERSKGVRRANNPYDPGYIKKKANERTALRQTNDPNFRALVGVAPDNRPLITIEQARQMLLIDNSHNVHSMMGGVVMMGANVDFGDVLNDARKFGIQLAGPRMMAMEHGLVIQSDKSTVFYATRPEYRDTLREMAEQYDEKMKTLRR